MTHASVFSGIGGPEVAATMLGWENLFHCEINPFGRAVLDYWYPNSKSYEDITQTDFTEWRGRVDVLTGGFPCQPFSYAGKRRGAEDDRYLWPSMYRAIDEIQPTWIVAENVAGILTMVEQGEVSKMADTASLFDTYNDIRGRYELRETFTLQRICTDLTNHGYDVQPVLIPACAVGAPHRRDRVFIVARRITANTDSERRTRMCQEDRKEWTDDKRQEQREIQRNPKRQSGCDAAANPSCCRKRASETGNSSEKSGSNTYQQQEEWGTAPEWSNRFYAILRHTADTANDRLQHDTITRSEAESNRETSRRGAELHISTEANGSGRPTPNPDSQRGCEVDEHMEPELADGEKSVSNGGQRNVADTGYSRCSRENESRSKEAKMWEYIRRAASGFSMPSTRRTGRETERENRWSNFPTIPAVHRGNDGLPFNVDHLTLSFGKWRTEALKAYGNAIVPQVMYEIFRAIEIVEQGDSIF